MIQTRPFFKILFPIEQQRLLEIPEGKSIIGRGLSADIRLNDDLVSREHCEITYSEGKLKLRDLHSTNGTLVNYNDQQEVDLNHGDHIQIGATMLKVIFQAPSDLTENFTKQDIFSKEYFISCVKGFLSFASRNNTSISIIDLKIKTNLDVTLPKSFTLKFASIINSEKNFLHLLHSPEPLHFKILHSGISTEDIKKEANIFTNALQNHKLFWNDSPLKLEVISHIDFLEFPKDILQQQRILNSLKEA